MRGIDTSRFDDVTGTLYEIADRLKSASTAAGIGVPSAEALRDELLEVIEALKELASITRDKLGELAAQQGERR